MTKISESTGTRARNDRERIVRRLEAQPADTTSTSPTEVLLTVDETAAVLRTSRKAIYAMAERGQLPGLTRIGRRVLVRRDDLFSWLDERRAASPGGIRR